MHHRLILLGCNFVRIFSSDINYCETAIEASRLIIIKY